MYACIYMYVSMYEGMYVFIFEYSILGIFIYQRKRYILWILMSSYILFTDKNGPESSDGNFNLFHINMFLHRI